MRDAQRRVLSVNNAGIFVSSDIVDTTKIDPRDKQNVALRFLNTALSRY